MSGLLSDCDLCKENIAGLHEKEINLEHVDKSYIKHNEKCSLLY